jgi:hypothetical protein
MKLFYCLIMLTFLSFPAFAAGSKPGACILKNTEFCGLWYDTQGFELTVTGDTVNYSGKAPCQIMKEGAFEDGRPFTLLKCIEQPDPRARFGSEAPRTTGYLFTYFEKRSWHKNQKYGSTQMYYYHYKDIISTNSCFTNNHESRKTCNISTLLEPDSWSSRHPIHKPSKK